jgi:hypothetical protein
VPSDGPKQEVVENPSDGSDATAGATPADISYADIEPIQPTTPTTPADQGASASLPSMPVPSATDPSDPDAGSADPDPVFGTPPSDAVVAALDAQNAQDLAALLSPVPIDQKPSSDGSTDPKAAGAQDSDQDDPEPTGNENFSLSLGAATFLVPDSADQEPADALDSTYVPENMAPGQEWSPVESASPGGGAEGGGAEGGAEPSGAMAPDEPSSPGSDYDGGLEGGGEDGLDHSGGGSPEPEEPPSGEPPPDDN